jgi:hypothetical protein
MYGTISIGNNKPARQMRQGPWPTRRQGRPCWYAGAAASRGRALLARGPRAGARTPGADGRSEPRGPRRAEGGRSGSQGEVGRTDAGLGRRAREPWVGAAAARPRPDAGAAAAGAGAGGRCGGVCGQASPGGVTGWGF